jgi:hypothetical protein
MSEPIKAYLKSIERQLAQGNSTEHTHRPALKTLLEAIDDRVLATNEPKRIECGAPDFVLSRGKENFTIGYLEAKDVGVPLDETEKSEQLKRYLHSLPNLILTDYLEFRWYVDGEYRSSARLARPGKGGRLAIDKNGEDMVPRLLCEFLAHEPVAIASPEELSRRMADLTKMIRNIIVDSFVNDRASQGLKDLRKAFAETLIPDIGSPEKTGEFADMYAQTIAYGLFAARCNHSRPEPFKRLEAAAEIPKTNPFLRKLFEVITGPDLNDEPYAGFVEDLVQVLAHSDMAAVLEDFGRRTGQEDPIVHFYETFLAAYDPKLRESRGVYYTPAPVVSYIVRSVDRILKERFGFKEGLADPQMIELTREDEEVGRVEEHLPKALILDPACGTGTFLYAVVDHIRNRFIESGNAGMWSGFVRRQLLARLFGFELLMAPYSVAHFKLGMQLAAQDLEDRLRKKWAYDFNGNERLNVFLTNTLEEAEQKVEDLFGPLRVITEEANAASRVKKDLPIMVILGNPPYSGHSANRSWEVKDGKRQPTFIGGLVQDYYQVDGQPLKEKNPKWLQDDYVKFLRWSQWRIEQTGAGVLAFITNHGYLDNPTFRGMRQSLMKTFDDIYIIDLHGNSKKKEKCPDGSKDENVFDIQQGVAIAIMIKDGKNG